MIYLDHNATTPVAEEVLEAMLPYFRSHFGNPASGQHAFGWVAEEAVQIALSQITSALNVKTSEICFTSGATESCNLALKGIYGLYQRKGRHIVTVSTEHKAVLDTCRALESIGAEITYLPVNDKGHLDQDQLRDAIRPDTILVSVMWANNETGVIHPIREIGSICADKGTLLFSDATQAVGKVAIDPRSAGVQLMAFSAHKFYGPKGSGCLYLSNTAPRIRLAPLIHGGGHQGGVRSGTLNVPGIVGMGKALELSVAGMTGEQAIGELRDELEGALLSLPAVSINGDRVHRLSNVSNLRFEGIDSAAVMSALSKDIAIASGSACTSANPEPSHVLQAMGLSRDQSKSSLRFSLGRFNTREEIKSAAELLADCVTRLRSTAVRWNM